MSEEHSALPWKCLHGENSLDVVDPSGNLVLYFPECSQGHYDSNFVLHVVNNHISAAKWKALAGELKDVLEKIHLEIILDMECTCATNPEFVCDYHVPQSPIEKLVNAGLAKAREAGLGE